MPFAVDTLVVDEDALVVRAPDVHVTASALKLYFRELKEPLIPFKVYAQALEAAHDHRQAAHVVDSLPRAHRLATCYLVRFLQVFSAPEHVRHTKMDDANLAMVWAPNLLRAPPQPEGGAPHDSLSSIFERTRAEMSFVRTLIQQLDTSFMAGVQ